MHTHLYTLHRFRQCGGANIFKREDVLTEMKVDQHKILYSTASGRSTLIVHCIQVRINCC
jgi:hypothetical protein